MYCVETTDLAHRYADGARVPDGISLQVPTGSIYGFLGPNGAGKTTTLRLILGLLGREQGRIAIFGKDFASQRISILRELGSLIESPSLYEHLTAEENLRVLQKVHRCPESRIPEVLAQVGLTGTRKKRAGQFSLGMKQRLGIAAALLHSPKLLILDEPTNGLDPNGIIEIRELLRHLNRDQGITLLISSHLLAEMEKLVTHLGIISKGRLVFQGTLEELKRRQQQVLSITLHTSDPAATLALATRQGHAGETRGDKVLFPALDTAHVAALNRGLVLAGIEVYEISTARDDLESIFMDLIGGRP